MGNSHCQSASNDHEEGIDSFLELFGVSDYETLMYYVDFYSLFNNPGKDWEAYLKEKAESPPEPSLFD